jgi:hypothetical protein
MSNDIVHIDNLMCKALKIPPDDIKQGK